MPGGLGMLKLRFDWYISQEDKVLHTVLSFLGKPVWMYANLYERMQNLSF